MKNSNSASHTIIERVLFITPFFRPSVGGAETLLDDIVAYLRKHEFFVYVVTLQPITINVRGEPIERGTNLEIHRYSWFGHTLFNRFLRYHPVFNFLYISPYLLLRSFVFMVSNYRSIDVVDSHGFSAAFAAKILKYIFHKRTIMSVVAMYDFDKQSLFARTVCWVLASADRIIVESPQSEKELVAIGVDQRKITRFVEWVDLEEFKPGDKTRLKKELGLSQNFTVLFVGRAIEAKGVDIAIEVARHLKDINFVFISTAGLLVGMLESASRDAENITFIKGVDYRYLPRYYASADIFIVPSRSEDAPRTAVEAISCGTPVVGSNVGGIPSVVDESVGILVEPTVEEFVKVLGRLYADRKKLLNLTINCRSYAVKNFSSKNASIFAESYLCERKGYE